MTTPTADFLSAALKAIAKGTPIFPCVAGKKSPATAHGFQDATTDEAAVRQWAAKWPTANLAIPTGERSRLIVLDVDRDEGKDGEAALSRLTNQHGALPATLEVRTPRGGRHLYFKHPGVKIPTRTNHPAPALDVRGDGGYVLIPPSATERGAYTWATRTAPAECPPWLLALLLNGAAPAEKPQAVTPSPAPTTTSTDPTEEEARIREALRFIPADDYDTWTRIGMAIHSEMPGARGLALWDAWSRTCPDKYDERQPPKKWASFKADRPGGVTLGTLYEYAKRGGWPPPPAARVFLGGAGAKAEPSGPPDTWGTPEPFSSADVPLAPWPWEVFPPVLADLGREIVRTIGTCDELPGLGLLCVASIALRNKVKVQIKQGHTQHTNLYGLAVLSPNQKKTPVGKVLLPPFTDWQKEQKAAYGDALNQWEAKARIARARVAKMEKTAGDANDEEAQELQHAIEEQQKVLKAKPVKPCLFTNDATSERVARLMDEHGGAMGVFTSEGRKVLAIARGRYMKGGGSDVDLWLAAYSGDYIRVDRNREGFEPIELPEPVLSAFVAAQPDTLRALGENEEIRASGFLARWDYICPAAITAAEYRTASIAPHIQHAYAEAIRRLIELPYAVFPDGTPAPHLIGFTLDAFQRWAAYHNELAAEAGRSVGHKPTAFVEWMGKLPERVARIAGIFRAVRHVAEGVPLGAIDAPEIDAAYMVTLALLTHGKRAFGLMGQDSDQAKARCLWRALDERRVKLRDEREREGLGRIEAVKPKDVARGGWAGIEKTDEARRVLEVLSTKGWLSDAVTLPGKARGQQHDLYYLRPDSPEEGGKL